MTFCVTSDKSLWCALISRKLVIFIRNISLGQCSRLKGWLALLRPMCAFKTVSRFSILLPNINVLLPDPCYASKSHVSLGAHVSPCERWEQSVAANADSEASATYSYSSYHFQGRARYKKRIPYISSDSPRESNTACSLGHPSRKIFSAILMKGLPVNSGVGGSQPFAFWVHSENRVNIITWQWSKSTLVSESYR